MSDNEDDVFGLVMPFVTVASVGGPHEDNSYVHGYEMGTLDAVLATGHKPTHSATIHEANSPQADLIAMRHGYRMELVTTGEGWVEVEFVQLGDKQPDEAAPAELSTHAGLDQAIRAHVAEKTDGAYVTAWHVVAHGTPPANPKGSHYVYANSDDAPHVWLGLVEMASRRAKRWQHEEDT